MRSIATLSVAAATLALSLLPASAQSWNGNGGWNNGWNGQNQSWNSNWNGNGWNNGWRNDGWSYQRQGWNSGWNGGYNGYGNGYSRGWNSRNVSGSDPSFGNRGGLNYARGTGRCVEDLGYGRFEYCGW